MSGVRAHGSDATPLVAVIMGSRSDWETMEHAPVTLARLEIPHERSLGPPHSPCARGVRGRCRDSRRAGVHRRGGGAAHLAGVVASKTLRLVLGVPMGTQLGGLDSLLSTVQMPAGIRSRPSPSDAPARSTQRSWPRQSLRWRILTSTRAFVVIARSSHRPCSTSATRAPDSGSERSNVMIARHGCSSR